MKAIFKKANGIIYGLTGEDAGTDTPEYKSLEVPPSLGMTTETMQMWKVDVATETFVKVKPDAEIEAVKKAATIASLKRRYLDNATRSVESSERVELVLDALVQIVDRLVDGQTPTSQEKAGWKKLLDGLKSDYKKAVKDIDDADKDDLKVGKKGVRKAETDMKNDPEWPA